ncbi:MAG: DUF445 family protein [Spirochaetaceae bacterium]|jgi:uncharacterized membrane-anchored protein YjiN (DUF445 family)|nr:DUF445 family protein [Spirochaetaceae bacterium]
MKPLLVWLFPPLVGALIGYVTNAVAIKMLFRPLKAIFVWGIRLPFTPGILPRQRHKLADNIGTMVEREFFTPEIIKARLRRSDVRENIRESIALYTEKILNLPLGRITQTPAVQTNQSPPFPEAGAQEIILRFILGFIKSPAIDSILDNLFLSLADTYGNRTLRDIVGNDGVLENILEGIIREGLNFSAPEIQNALTQRAGQAGSVLIDSLIQFLKKEDIHRELETHGRIFLNRTILKLNVFQRLFISAGQYDRTLHERMPEIIDDLILELEHLVYDEDTNQRIVAFLREKVRTFVSGGEFSGEFAREITKPILACLDRPLGELIPQWTGIEFSHLGPKILFLIKKREGLDIKIRLALDRFFETHRELSLAELFSLDAEKKEKIDALIGDKMLLIMDEQIESLLRSINIKTLVADRINSLDMIRVEGIVLDVMAHQLKWINFFGAVLGALIGVFQSFFSWLIK